MKILCALYYYYPYISGLSIYCRKLAEHMRARGHEVTIVTSRYDRDLDAEEVVKGVRVIRAPVWFRLDKGVIMGSFLPTIIRLGRRCDVVNLHLPMVEAWPIARLLPKKTVLTYHCQIRLNNRTLLGRLVERGIKSSFRRAIASSPERMMGRRTGRRLILPKSPLRTSMSSMTDPAAGIGSAL